MHRIGQKKEVYVDRLIVAGSLEVCMLALQDHKKKLAAHSLGEGTGQKLRNLGV